MAFSDDVRGRIRDKRELESLASPSQDHTPRFEIDQLLRKHGFKIHSRRGDKIAVWERGGELYTQNQALGEVDSWAEVRRAQDKQNLYYEGSG